MRILRGWTRRWRARSLRFQLAAIIALVGLFLLLLNTSLLGVLLNQFVADREGTALGQQVAVITRCSSDAFLMQLYTRRPSAGNTMEAVLGSTQDRHAIVVDSSGVVRYVTPMPPVLRSTLLTRLRRDLVLDNPTVGATPRWQVVRQEIVADAPFTCPAAVFQTGTTTAGTIRGGLLLAEDRRVVQSIWDRLFRIVLIAGLVATILAVIAGLAAGETMTRSVRAVTRAARAIAAGDIRRRVAPRGPAEINEMSVAFNRMVEEVLRRRRVERDLLANISHELASPLGLIRGYAEALADGILVDAPERAAALQAIRLETARLQRLTADLLDLVLLESGQVSVHVEEVPVGELLTGLQERLAPMMRRAGVTSSVDAPRSLPAVWTDGQRLEQVLVNLLNNAVRHTPSGGSIAMAAAQDDHGVSITVNDSGSGIPPAELSRIWERFYQVEPGRDRRDHEAGVGLGLAICRSTVALLQGSIDVNSTPGAGATFTIHLPFRMGRSMSHPV